MTLEDDLREVLLPIVEQLVREAFERELHPWRWASIRQAAEILDLSETAVKMRVKRRQLPSVMLEGRRYVDLRALDEHLQSLSRQD